MIAVFLLAMAIALLLVLFFWRSGQCSSSRSQRSVDVCLVLLNLMQELQRHRALSIAVLDGQFEFRKELGLTEHMLQRTLHALADQYGDRHAIFSSEQWHIVLRHWESLRNNWRELDFVTNLFAHNEIVLGLIGILQALADDEPKRLGANRVQIITHWPHLIEHLGMLRTLGVHSLSQKDPLSDARINLSITDHWQHATQELTQLSEKIPDASIVTSSEMLLRRVALLTEDSAQTYNAQTFYEDMTTLIDQWYRMITSQITQQA